MSDRLGPVSYLIQLENGDYWRRHVDHLRTGSDPESKPTEKEPSCSPHSEEIPDDMSPASSAGTQKNHSPRTHTNSPESRASRDPSPNGLSTSIPASPQVYQYPSRKGSRPIFVTNSVTVRTT